MHLSGLWDIDNDRFQKRNSRDCGNGYYAAYVLDPDGNNIEAGLRSEA